MTDQKGPYYHTSNQNKLLVIGKNVGLCLCIYHIDTKMVLFQLGLSWWFNMRGNLPSRGHQWNNGQSLQIIYNLNIKS